jgi:hypothetical protein
MFLSSSVNEPPKYQFLLAWIVGTVFLYLICGRIKKVQIDGNQVVVSNYFSSDVLNLSEIISVSGSIFLTPELVWFKLRVPIKYGQSIIFIPPFRFFGGFSKHPMVKELKSLCNL